MGSYVKIKSDKTLYVEDTPGDQGTIVAAHGLTGNHKQFHYYREALGGKYRFISYDIRGRGNSDAASTDTSIFTHSEDLLELIDVLDIERPILMGYSMGAYVCALAATRLSNVSSLILLDGAGDADETTRELVLPSLNRMKKSYPSADDYVEETRRLYTNLNIEWDDTLDYIVRYEIQKKANKEWQHKSKAPVMEKDFESFYSFDTTKTFSSLSFPTFLVIATGGIGQKRSLFTEKTYEKTRQVIPDLQSIITPVNHYELVFNAQPDIYEQIDYFLTNKRVNL